MGAGLRPYLGMSHSPFLDTPSYDVNHFRQSKNHKTRIIIFVGSPIDSEEKDLQRLAKKLKKEKVNVDIVNFGETEENTEKLTNFVSTLNGKEGTGE